MQQLLQNNRFIVLAASVAISLLVQIIVMVTTSSEQLQTIRLAETYALFALAFLYLTLLANPFCSVFTHFIWRKQYLNVHQSLGIVAFYFGLLHGNLSFFGLLNGFEGLSFLPTIYVYALLFSATAFIILLLHAIIALPFLNEKVPARLRKIINASLYIAGISILVHALFIGSHFQDPSSVIYRITFLAVGFLFILEAIRIDTWLQKNMRLPKQFGSVSLLVAGFIIFYTFLIFNPSQKTQLFGMASQHQMSANTVTAMDKSMQGDKSLRYTVSFAKPQTIIPNQITTLSFTVQNASNGNDVTLFQKLYEKEAHVVIVDDSLQYFTHIHPERTDNVFTITTQLPKPGVYRAYLSYQPIGALEQQVGFRFIVGQNQAQNTDPYEQKIDTEMTKTFGNYKITLDTGKGITAKAMNAGTQTLGFTLRNAQTKQPVTTMQPYLGAFGHLVMVHEGTHAYIHIHPKDIVTNVKTLGGPRVDFIPMALSDSIKPGVYKVFAEFNPDGKYTVAEFKIWVY